MRAVLLVLAGPLLAAPLLAQDTYKDIEYVTGREGHPDKKKGHLIVTADSVTFATTRDEPIFSIPTRSIKDATNQIDVRGASVGKKMLFGVFAGDRKQDFVTINVETDSTAEAIVFKTKQHTSAGIAAKINFQVKKVRERTPLPDPQEMPDDTLTASKS